MSTFGESTLEALANTYLSASGIASGLGGSTGLAIALDPSKNPNLSVSSVKSFPDLKLPLPMLKLTNPI